MLRKLCHQPMFKRSKAQSVRFVCTSPENDARTFARPSGNMHQTTTRRSHQILVPFAWQNQSHRIHQHRIIITFGRPTHILHISHHRPVGRMCTAIAQYVRVPNHRQQGAVYTYTNTPYMGQGTGWRTLMHTNNVCEAIIFHEYLRYFGRLQYEHMFFMTTRDKNTTIPRYSGAPAHSSLAETWWQQQQQQTRRLSLFRTSLSVSCYIYIYMCSALRAALMLVLCFGAIWLQVPREFLVSESAAVVAAASTASTSQRW